jgi:hypothetical protein
MGGDYREGVWRGASANTAGVALGGGFGKRFGVRSALGTGGWPIIVIIGRFPDGDAIGLA